MNDIRLSELVGLGTVSAFFLTIIYSSGYSKILGVNLLNYFTANDYFKASISWLAPLVIAAAIGGISGLLSSGIKNGAIKKEPEAELAFPFVKIMDLGAKTLVITLPACALTGAMIVFLAPFIKREVSSLVLAFIYLLWAYALAVIWLKFIIWYISEPMRRDNLSKAFTTFLIVFPALAFYAYFNGKSQAEFDYAMRHTNSNTRVVIDNNKDILIGKILFILDEYLVMRQEQSEQLKLIPSNNIKMIIYD